MIVLPRWSILLPGLGFLGLFGGLLLESLLEKLDAAGVTLGEAVKDPGVHTGNCSAELVREQLVSGAVRVLEGKQISRYACSEPQKYLDLGYAAKLGQYFRIGPVAQYANAKFVIRQTAAYPIVGPREHAEYFRNSLLALYEWPPHDVRYVVGLLNSALMRFYYESTTAEAGQKAFPQVKVKSIRQLPIRPIEFSDPADVARHDRMVGLVQAMLDLHRRLPAAQTPRDRELLERQIADTDRAIDALVYEFYGLTAEEIALVGGER